jgi:hypothetical protein
MQDRSYRNRGNLLHRTAGPYIRINHQKVFCFSPHSLQVYATRSCPGAADTRFGAPHFPHFVSIRVWPCLTVTVFRSIASFTKRSVSSRIACFDISFLSCLHRVPTCAPRRCRGSLPDCMRTIVVHSLAESPGKSPCHELPLPSIPSIVPNVGTVFQ